MSFTRYAGDRFIGPAGETGTFPLDVADGAMLVTSGVNSTDLALSVLINYLDNNEADTYITLSLGGKIISRTGKFIGDEYRVTLGSAEMALDCLRRHLSNLPFDEKSDFER